MALTLTAAKITWTRQGAHSIAAISAPTINGSDAKLETTFIATVSTGDRNLSTNSK